MATVIGKRYTTEYYVDIIHEYGFIQVDNCFVGEPYNIIISLERTANRNFVVKRSIKPENNYSVSYSEHDKSLIDSDDVSEFKIKQEKKSFDHETEDVELTEEYVVSCMKYLEETERLENMKMDLLNNTCNTIKMDNSDVTLKVTDENINKLNNLMSTDMYFFVEHKRKGCKIK